MTENLIKRRIVSNMIFANCIPETLDTLLRCPLINYERGEQVDDGDCAKLGIVITGRIVARSIGNHSVFMNAFEPGEVFGAAQVFSNENKISKLSAEAKSMVLFVDKDVIEYIFSMDSSVAISYARFLSQKICFLNKKINTFTAQRSDASLSLYLLGFANEMNTFHLNVSSASDTLGIGRTTLYRAMDRLVQDEIIDFDKGLVTIKNKSELEKRGKK